MPFGLTNAPSTFQAVMNSAFLELLRKCVLIFFDDILVYSKSWEEHLVHLKAVFEILRANQLLAKQSKCTFGVTKIEYLGHVISAEGVSTDPSKSAAIKDWPIPKTVKQLRGFLGLAGYYRRFIKDYGKISKPLTILLQKDGFFWNADSETAFNTLKAALISAPVLALPDFMATFILETYASNTGI